MLNLLLEALLSGGGVEEDALASKLMCFAADGVSVFQGYRTRVTTQLVQNFAPFMIGVHCFAHRLNLAAHILETLLIFQNYEKLM